MLKRIAISVLAMLVAQSAVAVVVSETKISSTQGGFGGALSNFDRFGDCAAYLGDVDGDGVGDLAVAAGRDDDGAGDTGAAWILFLNPDGSVKSEQKISQGAGNFLGEVAASAEWGECLAEVGDLNYDGVPDLAVADWKRSSPGVASTGAVWILFLNADGTVRSEQLIDAVDIPGLEAGARFGRGIGAAGDVDGDGVMDLAVGVSGNNGGGNNRGGVWIVFLEPDGWVKGAQLIEDGVGGLSGGLLSDSDFLGIGKFDRIGDLDGNGVPDLAVGAQGDDTGGADRGAVWIFFLNSDGTLAGHQKIASATGGFTGTLDDGDQFGDATAGLGDLDGDGVPDIAVGAGDDDDGATDAGAVWVLFLNANGTVKGHEKISATSGGFGGALGASDHLGFSLAALPDLAGGSPVRLAATAMGDDDGGSGRGAVWVLELAGDPQPAVCGDFIQEAAEECDDGNTESGDTCSATCEDEDVVLLAGVAAGGANLSLTVSGEAIVVPTGAGQSGAQVLAATAGAINADGTLQGLGVTAVATGDALYTNGSVTSQSTSDGGLELGARDDLVLEGSSFRFDLDVNVAPRSYASESPPDVLPGRVRAEASFASTLFSIPLYWYETVTTSPGRSLQWWVQGLACTGGFVGFAYPSLGQSADARGRVGGGNLWCGIQNHPSGYLNDFSFVGPAFPIGSGPVATTGLAGKLYGNVFTDGTATVSARTVTGSFSLPTTITAQRRGIEARRPDLVGTLNTVTPVAIASGSRGFGGFGTLRFRFAPEPEATTALLAGGAILLAWARRRRSRAR